MIKLQVIGHLGKDATVNSVGETKVINFNVAHTEKFKGKDGVQQSKTTWVECAKWGENTNVAQYMLKGGTVYVEGTPEIKSYENKEGKTVSSIGLRVDRIELLGSAKPAGEQTSNGAAKTEPAKTQATNTDAPPPVETGSDDLPF